MIDLNRADPELPSDLLGLIESGDAGLDRARGAVQRALASDRTDDGTVLPLDEVTPQAPVVNRPRVGCAAGNYAAHTLGSAKRKGVEESDALAGLVEPGAMPTSEEIVRRTRERGEPRGFWKDFADSRGPEETIPYPDRCGCLDYEGEVIVVLGERAKDVPPGKGDAYIWGVSLHNDLSIRDASGRRGRLSFNLSKNWDGSAAIGPCIVVGEIDPRDLEVETRVNGQLRQQYNSGDMIFSHGEYIEYLSRDFALQPGDMISGGTGPGTVTDTVKEYESEQEMTDARRRELYLKVGDVVEVSSPAIGSLRNRIVAKED